MSNVTLIIDETESTIPLEELTIERIIAEAHAVGYGEFSVYCNDKKIKKPDAFKAIPGATYIISPVENDFELDDIHFEEIVDENEADR